MWRISRIRLRDFKVYEGEYSFDLRPVTVIVGRVGAGKSSLLQAVEFALFGREMEVRERIARMADLINANSSSAYVDVELAEGGDRAAVRRRLNRRGASSLELEAGGVKYSGEEAEERLRSLAGIGNEDFDRVVYISHYALEDFIHGDKQRRTIIIDKLLGIDSIDYIQKIILQYIKGLINAMEKVRLKLSYYEQYKDIFNKYGNLSNIKSIKEELENELDSLNKRENIISIKYKQLLIEREKYINKIINLKDKIEEYFKIKSELELLEESGIAPSAELGPMEELRDKFLGTLADFEHLIGPELGQELAKEPDPGRLAELMQEAYDKLSALRQQLEREESSLEAQRRSLEKRLQDLRSEESSLRARAVQFEGAYRRYKELEANYGKLEELRKRLEELRPLVADLERRTAYISSLRYLLKYMAEAGVDECPICGAKVDKGAIAKRAGEVDAAYSSQLEELGRRRAALEELEAVYREMSALFELVQNYIKAEEELKRISIEVENAEAKAAQVSKALQQLQRREDALAKFLSEVNDAVIGEVIRRYNKALRISRLRERAEELERDLLRAGATRGALEAEEELRKLSEELDRMRRRKADIHAELNKLLEVLSKVDEDLDALRARLERLSSAYNRLTNIYNKLNIVKINIRNKIINEIKNNLSKIFMELYPYGDISGVNIRAEDKGYEIEALLSEGAVMNIARLSDGQRLAAALSLVVAVREVMGLRLGFLLLDDPLPYVDPNVRAALAGLIAKLSSKYQVVVATQSMDLAREIGSRGIDLGIIEIKRDRGRPEVAAKHIFGEKVRADV